MDDWFSEGGSGTPVDLPALFDGPAGERLFEVAALGALVSVGLTRDSGAVGVTITNGGRWRREYFRDPEALADWLESAAVALGRNGLQPAASASTARRKAVRGA